MTAQEDPFPNRRSFSGQHHEHRLIDLTRLLIAERCREVLLRMEFTVTNDAISRYKMITRDGEAATSVWCSGYRLPRTKTG